MIRVTLAQANRFILQKNHLTSPKTANLLQLVAGVVGLPGEPYATPFLAAHARLADFSPDQLLAELYQRHSLIKSNLMRNVSYIVPVERYVSFHAATARQRNQDFNSGFRLWGLDNSEVQALEKAILAAVDDEPLTAESIAARLPQTLVRELTQTSRGGRVEQTSNVTLVLRWLVARGLLSAGQDPATLSPEWQTERLIYAPLSYWYPGLNLATAPHEAAAQAELVHAYLATFGPVTEADISFWTGFGKSETARAINTLTPKTTLALVEGIPGMLLLLKEQAEALHATQAPQEPVINVLPADDPFTTAHRASRTRFFTDQKLQRHVFSSSGAAKPTLLLNGQVIGTWEWQTAAEPPQIRWRLLAEVDSSLVPLMQAELERLAAFIQPNHICVAREND